MQDAQTSILITAIYLEAKRILERTGLNYPKRLSFALPPEGASVTITASIDPQGHLSTRLEATPPDPLLK
jgi:hypothetical protein